MISSQGECINALNGGCAIADFLLEDMLNTPVIVDHVHERLFTIESFDRICKAMHDAERRILEVRH